MFIIMYTDAHTSHKFFLASLLSKYLPNLSIRGFPIGKPTVKWEFICRKCQVLPKSGTVSGQKSSQRPLSAALKLDQEFGHNIYIPKKK